MFSAFQKPKKPLRFSYQFSSPRCDRIRDVLFADSGMLGPSCDLLQQLFVNGLEKTMNNFIMTSILRKAVQWQKDTSSIMLVYKLLLQSVTKSLTVKAKFLITTSTSFTSSSTGQLLLHQAKPHEMNLCTHL